MIDAAEKRTERRDRDDQTLQHREKWRPNNKPKTTGTTVQSI